jgi:RHS repeat-associated protein
MAVSGGHFVYNAFGLLVSGNAALTRYLYTGQEYDAQTGTYLYNLRWYDPFTGRWQSQDLIWDGTNLHAYVGNSSPNATDPSGLCDNPVFSDYDRWLLDGGMTKDPVTGHPYVPSDPPRTIKKETVYKGLWTTLDEEIAKGTVNPGFGHKVLRFFLQPLFPDSTPKREIFYSDGTREVFTGQGPSNDRALGQGMAILLPFARCKAPNGRLPGSNPEWGRNRLIKELHDRGFQLQGPTKTGGGLIYRNPKTGEVTRIMPRPNRPPFRGEPPAKFEGDYYYRYQPNPNLPEGPHIPLPNS